MLIAKAMQEERYEDAQRILDGIPDRTVDKEERQAILYAREGKDEDAARTWEARVIRIAADLMGAIVGLIEIALRDGRKDDALECVHPRSAGIRGTWSACMDESDAAAGGRDGIGRFW